MFYLQLSAFPWGHLFNSIQIAVGKQIAVYPQQLSQVFWALISLFLQQEIQSHVKVDNADTHTHL